jgi:hypothetical protein
VRFVHPDSLPLNIPNKITAADFNNWCRSGIYFTMEWDPQYQTVLPATIPASRERRRRADAHYGKGTFIYTATPGSVSSAGVSGAYKMFVNLVSAK